MVVHRSAIVVAIVVTVVVAIRSNRGGKTSIRGGSRWNSCPNVVILRQLPRLALHGGRGLGSGIPDPVERGGDL